MTDDVPEMDLVDLLLTEFDRPLTGRAASPLHELVRRGTIGNSAT